MVEIAAFCNENVVGPRETVTRAVLYHSVRSRVICVVLFNFQRKFMKSLIHNMTK